MAASISNFNTTFLQDLFQSKVRTEKKYQYFEKNHDTSLTTASINDFSINERIIQLLEKFSELTDNWDEDDAKAPSVEVINFAQYLVNVLSKAGHLVFHAAPGPNGEIMLDLRNKEKSLELIIYPHKKVAVKIPAVGTPSQSNFDESDLPQLLQWLNVKDK